MSYSPPPAGLAICASAGVPPWRRSERIFAVVSGGLLLALLVTAAWLSPSSAGVGTHRQLGLPPCTVLDWFGFRCPSCGMTTAWAHFVRGQIWLGMRANAGGTMLAAVAAAVAPWLVGSGFAGRWWMITPPEKLILGCGLAIMVITLTQWSRRPLLPIA